MEYQDLRDWIQIADEMGELKTLKGCDWNLEIGAVTELVAIKKMAPPFCLTILRVIQRVTGCCPIPLHRGNGWR